jgi:DNA-binding transcriptional regulator GbsR (MarR family)
MSEAIALSPAATRFILHWGELGSQWGISRSVAQIHALLYLSPEPLHAAQIADTLNLARSNVSTSIRELQGWGIVRVTHKLGDRRDHFESSKDVWEMFRTIAEERKRREIDTTLQMLRAIQAEDPRNAPDAYTRDRIDAMESFFSSVTVLLDDLHAIPLPVLRKLAGARGRLLKLFAAVHK